MSIYLIYNKKTNTIQMSEYLSIIKKQTLFK